ncbi:hypothetical protein EDE12_105126 [Methylosinus sp. sav-2]|jgi:hypothetical protein|uniref:hypothetical protein n=1 Tax=Methylosinus sp. LW3 TaxID=107635 RepID=UPI00055A50CA|nr:hypothetical protein [Methylosinus sp. LW3]TDX64290.1 hypothetical protein EDE12_105126 [Methylosinus sp. sav-2]
MSMLDRFRRDTAGRLVEKVALGSAVLALACVLGANLLSAKLQNGELPLIAFVHKEERGRAQLAASQPSVATQVMHRIGFVGVDHAATGSISPAQKAVAPVSPCGAEAK